MNKKKTRRTENKMENETKKTEEISIQDWLEQEEQTLKTPLNFEKKPALKLETGKITSFEIDFSKPFEKWTDEKNGKKITKAIIPITANNEKQNLWLNVKNPLYGELIKEGKKGTTKFKVFTTGNQAETKYAVVKD